MEVESTNIIKDLVENDFVLVMTMCAVLFVVLMAVSVWVEKKFCSIVDSNSMNSERIEVSIINFNEIKDEQCNATQFTQYSV